MRRSDYVRMGYAVMYTITSLVNLFLAVRVPGVIRSLSHYALIPVLANILSASPDWLCRAALLLFSGAQATFALMILSRGFWVKLGLLGAVIFHLSILPFGLFNLPNLPLAVAPAWLLIHGEFPCTVRELVFGEIPPTTERH